MTHLRLPALGLILAVVLCFQTAHAQQTNPPTGDHAAEAALREKAFKLLESLSDQLGILQSAENRARMGSNIAESIWSHDETRARALFASVEQDINLGLQPNGNDRDAERTFAVFLKLRQDVVERIAKHDPELALAFLKRTEPPSNATLSWNLKEEQQAFELRLAKRIAAESPEAAVKLARNVLAKGFSNDLIALLIKLSSKDKDQATIVYREIVARLKDANLAREWVNMQFASSLLRVFAPPAADDSTYRELVDLLLAQALAHGCGKPVAEQDEERSGFCYQVGSLLPLMAKVAPTDTRRMKDWWPPNSEVIATEPSVQVNYELNDLAQNGSVDEMLALIPKHPDLEGEIRSRAMWKAELLGDLERAQKIASAYTGNDPNVRRTLDVRLKAYNMTSEMIEQKLAEAQKKVSQLPLPEQIELLFSLANQIAPQNPKTAVRLVDRIRDMAGAFNGEKQVRLNIGVAIVYCLAQSDQGFAIMESLLPKLNELIAANAKLDSFDTHYLRDGEWNMSAEGATGELLNFLANNAGYFAWYDFDRAINLAAQFERAEIRMMAQLKLAQGILAGPPKRLPISPSRLF
jgi:hypothetical protein